MQQARRYAGVALACDGLTRAGGLAEVEPGLCKWNGDGAAQGFCPALSEQCFLLSRPAGAAQSAAWAVR